MLGLRFRDAATERPVTEGLDVRVRRPNGTGRAAQAVQTVSGAYVAQGLDGLRPYERTPEDHPAPVPTPRRRAYHVEVHDRRGRFVPVVLKVRLPYAPDERLGGLYPVVDPPSEEQVEGNGPPEPTVYLFSAVQRPVPAGWAVVYADLVADDSGTQTPAAHAVLRVRYAVRSGEANGASGDNNNGEAETTEQVWFGIADAEGRVAVPFPLPRTRLETLSSDENGTESTGRPGRGRGRGRTREAGDDPGRADPADRREPLSLLSTRTWQLEVRVRYEPNLSIPDSAQRPLLRTILNQKVGTVYQTPDGSGRETLPSELASGKPLVLRTAGRSTLRIGPADDDS